MCIDSWIIRSPTETDLRPCLGRALFCLRGEVALTNRGKNAPHSWSSWLISQEITSTLLASSDAMMMVSMAGLVRMHHVGTYFFFSVELATHINSSYSQLRLRWGKTVGSLKSFSFGPVSSKLIRLSIIFHSKHCPHHNHPHRRPITLDAQNPKCILFLRAQEDKTRYQHH